MNLLARASILVALLGALLVTLPAPPARGDTCGTLPISVTCGASADPDSGYFHGVIGVAGQDWVLEMSSHSGTTAGCGDCTWTVILDCPGNSPQNPDSAPACAGLSAGNTCPDDRFPFRLYLSTSAVTDELVGTVCLGGSTHIVEISADAEADVERYLHDVTPPDLIITTRPRGSTLTGLPTYFTATAPADGLGPFAFGGPTVSESITLRPVRMSWQWGDGDASDWLAVGATITHRYLTSGRLDVVLTTQWSATYTASFDGHSTGPYDATGSVERAQHFTERVDTSRPILVSGGGQSASY